MFRSRGYAVITPCPFFFFGRYLAGTAVREAALISLVDFNLK